MRKAVSALTAMVLLNAMPALAQNVWSLTQEQRQKLIAEQVKQMQLTQQAQLNMQKQINEAYKRQQLAALETQRAQAQAIQAQNQAMVANQQANQAAFSAGWETGRVQSERHNMDAAVDMVRDAVTSWQPPKSYTAQAGKVALADPFADEPAQARVVDPLIAMREAVKGSCLVVDEERRLAKVAGECPLPGHSEKLLPGDYPVLASESALLDTPERVKAFLTASATPSASILVMRNDSQLIALR